MALVEAGKITAEDGAELLTALAQSQVASAGATAISGPRRLMLVGAAIALVGFMLPWFTVNITQAMRDAMSSVQQSLPQFSVQPQPTFNFTPQNSQNDLAVTPVTNAMPIIVRGGDVAHGLGWMVLAAGLVSACMPFFWTKQSASSRHQMGNAILAVLAAGSVLEPYPLSGSFNAVTSIEPGFIVVIAGYVVLWVGSVREYVSLHSHNMTLKAIGV